jgi:3,4-dihydroxy 2-butanone 4-phosphate synthase / GTP cyclohydrolase II
VERAIADVADGRMVVVLDAEDRQNEGDLILAAEHVTPEAINFMTRHARGTIALALTSERCDELQLELLPQTTGRAIDRAFTVTIEAASGVTTGISAADQAHTMKVAVDPGSDRRDIVVPGHVRPLRARAAGVLERAGHTEAAVDLARLAGCIPAGVTCQIQNEDGTMARAADLRKYCSRHGLTMVTIAELIAYRGLSDTVVEPTSRAAIRTPFGELTMIRFRSLVDAREHVALVKGSPAGRRDVLVRVHAGCLEGDAFHATCGCGDRLNAALAAIQREPEGVLVYLAPSERRADCRTPATELRDYGTGAQILAALGLGPIRLLSDRPKVIHGLDGHGLTVTGYVALDAADARA